MSDTNDLIDLMREYGVEVHMLGTDEEPSPTGVALADMLTEIHTLRSRINAERQPVSNEAYRRLAAYSNAVIGEKYPFRSDEPDDVAEAVRMGKAIHKRAVELFADLAPGPAVPVIPEGWHLNRVRAKYQIDEADNDVVVGYNILLKRSRCYGGDWALGEGETYEIALTAAIAAAKESDSE